MVNETINIYLDNCLKRSVKLTHNLTVSNAQCLYKVIEALMFETKFPRCRVTVISPDGTQQVDVPWRCSNIRLISGGLKDPANKYVGTLLSLSKNGYGIRIDNTPVQFESIVETVETNDPEDPIQPNDNRGPRQINTGIRRSFTTPLDT